MKQSMNQSATDARAALQVEGLTKEHIAPNGGRFVAVDGISFSLEPGAFYTLLGPSGCGKSTTLRAIAGLETIDAGRISVDGDVLNDVKAGINIAPNLRRLGMVFQSYAIWPHMTVRDNVAFPLQMIRPRLDSREMAARIESALAAVHLTGFENRMATALSGGQQQRLALARALVGRPRLLLLDEPLSNLDARLRESMLEELVRLQRDYGTTALYVTHDQTEALSMSTRIAVMNHGAIVQEGSPEEIYYKPADSFVAGFVGEMNRLSGTVVGGTSHDGLTTVELSTGDLVRLPGCLERKDGGPVTVGARYESVAIRAAGSTAAGTNDIPGKVEYHMFRGEIHRWAIRLSDGTLVMSSSVGQPDSRIEVGTPVMVYVDPEHLLIFPGNRAAATSAF